MIYFSHGGYDLEIASLTYSYSGRSRRASLSLNGSVTHTGMHCRFRIEGSKQQHKLVFVSAVAQDPNADTRALAIGIKNTLVEFFNCTLEVPETMRKTLIRCVLTHHTGQPVLQE